MTIDERLENIARNLDILTKLHLDGERDWREAQVINEKRYAANEKRFAQITRNFLIVNDSIKRLERIAVAHEERLDDIESGEQ